MGTDGGSKKTVDDMEGLSMQTCTIKEEWMDLEDLDFDVVVDVFNNNNSDNSDKGFQRQQSFLDILTDLTDYKDEEPGDEPVGDLVGGRACRQVQGRRLPCLRSALG